MANVNMPLPTRISQSSSGTKQFRINEVKFGNGYNQRSKDGINNLVGSWSIAWENVSQADKDTIVAALESTAGVDYINWTAPNESTSRTWIMSNYTIISLSGSIYNITANITQVFEL